MRVFAAGAAGAIGRQLLPQLVAQGHQVTATTRNPANAGKLRELGAEVAALEHGRPGVYNVVDDEPASVAEWLPFVAQAVGAKAPRRVPVWLGRLAAGETGVSMMTQIRGSSNARAKRELGWQPGWPGWREGFRRGLADAGPVHGAA